MYLDHGEVEIALEGLIIELMASNEIPIGFRVADLKSLAIDLGLRDDPVLLAMDGRWAKFESWPEE